MKKKDFVGIDISKDRIDVRLYLVQKQETFDNKLAGFKKMDHWLVQQVGHNGAWLVCFEHTGLYAVPLQVYLEHTKQEYVQVSGLQVKRSLGIQRGKNDCVDAKRLAEYAYLHRDTLRPQKLESNRLIRLKYLLSLRSRLVRTRAGFKASVKEYKVFLALSNSDVMIQGQQKLIENFTKQIKAVEKEIRVVIGAEKKIQDQFALATSVTGIGLISAANMIAMTNGFTAYTTWRKFACYAGSAPFEHQSGTSIRGKTRISHYANKQMKVILTSAAMAAIQFDPELRRYYQRRLSEGKPKKIVINIIRNKLISRVFAAIKRGTPYVKLQNYAA